MFVNDKRRKEEKKAYRDFLNHTSANEDEMDTTV
jgi:hypothetical protein